MWKFAITACDNNTGAGAHGAEFKIWCCATWECKQTIRFESVDDKPMFFKAEIDPTSSYLILTETGSRTLYIMQIIQSSDEVVKIDGEKLEVEPSDVATNGTKQFACFIKSIAQFPLSSPILSFGIVDAMVRKYKCACNDVYLLEELDDYDEDTMNRYCVVIHMFLVQPKSVQECHVLYQPTVAISADVGSSFSGLSEDETPRHSDELVLALKMKTEGNSMSSTMSSSSGSGIQIKNILESTTMSSTGSSGEKILSKPQSAINLMTPDSFHSSGKITPEGVSNEVYSALRMLAGEKPVDNAALLHLVNNNNNNQPNEDSEKIPLLQNQSDDSHIENNNVDIVPPMPPASMLSTTGISGGSSPSREVQEILSQKDSDINDFYDNSLEIQDDTDGSANGNGDAVDAKDEEKNSNQDDDETYILNNGKSYDNSLFYGDN